MTLTEPSAPLRWAGWLLTAEAIVAGLLALFLGYQAVLTSPENVGDALALTGFVGLLAAALAGLAVALRRRKPRARAPAIVLQLLAVMFAYVLITDGLLWLGLPLAAVGVAVVTLLLAPATGQALTGNPPQ